MQWYGPALLQPSCSSEAVAYLIGAADSEPGAHFVPTPHPDGHTQVEAARKDGPQRNCTSSQDVGEASAEDALKRLASLQRARRLSRGHGTSATPTRTGREHADGQHAEQTPSLSVVCVDSCSPLYRSLQQARGIALQLVMPTVEYGVQDSSHLRSGWARSDALWRAAPRTSACPCVPGLVSAEADQYSGSLKGYTCGQPNEAEDPPVHVTNQAQRRHATLGNACDAIYQDF